MEKFSDKILDSMEKHIPKMKPKLGPKANNKKYVTPLDNNALRKIKRKHRAWTRYMESRESKHYQIYVQLRNQVRQLTRKARIIQEKSVASEAKKTKWKFAKEHTKFKKIYQILKLMEVRTTSSDSVKAY